MAALHASSLPPSKRAEFLTLSRATAQYCATAMCLVTQTNICVANNTIIVKRKRPLPWYIRGVVYTKSNAEAHARYGKIFYWLRPQKS